MSHSTLSSSACVAASSTDAIVTPNVIKSLEARLSRVLGDRLSGRAAVLEQYGHSEGHHALAPPQLVAWPTSVDEVQTIVSACADLRVPIVPHGAGTSLEGNAASPRGGLCLDVARMDRIIDVRAEDLLCVVQPGVTREALNTELRDSGLFFPIDPGANATLGGMIATRASGTNAVRYGTMRENTLALQIVTADGRLIHTGSRARKSSAGYDLTHLMVGSEGTLGVIVEATLRLYGRPDSVIVATCPFETLAGAVETVTLTIQMGVPIARMELLDPAAIAACNAYSRLEMPLRTTLFLEFHGSAAGIAEQSELVESIAAQCGGGAFGIARSTEDRTRLWAARHAALPAARALVPGAVTWVSDVCVPISHLAEAIENAQSRIAACGLTAPILGHVGDGNFHVFFVLAPDDAAGWARAAEVNEAMIRHALSVGGTCTGEHGIGIGKRNYMLLEHGGDALAMMAAIKRTLDPDNILNPGKIFLD